MTEFVIARVSELWFLRIAFLHNVCYQSMKFQVDSLSSLKDVAWTKIQNEIVKGQLLKMYTISL